MRLRLLPVAKLSQHHSHYTPQSGSGNKTMRRYCRRFHRAADEALTSSACVTLIRWPPSGISTSASTRRAGIKGSRPPWMWKTRTPSSGVGSQLRIACSSPVHEAGIRLLEHRDQPSSRLGGGTPDADSHHRPGKQLGHAPRLRGNQRQQPTPGAIRSAEGPARRAATGDQHDRVGLQVAGHLVGQHAAERHAAQDQRHVARRRDGFGHPRGVVAAAIRSSAAESTAERPVAETSARCGSSSRWSAPRPGSRIS